MSVSVREKQKTAFEELKKTGAITNIMQAPKLEKIVISVGVGKDKDDKRKIAVIEDRLAKLQDKKHHLLLLKNLLLLLKYEKVK